MAWIPMIPDDEVSDDYLRTLYGKYSTPSRGVDHIMKIHSLNPKSMELHHDYYKHLMTGRSGLSRAQREMIAMVVSKANGCHY
ncbi:MAG: carboxymuconolactone decarboxylase family protein [Candidatus Krumholzibacteriota bacterium]|nr:carboxymuconolactone decarboxylase family protein [Candidatus Krumholzibacteriota bacterium]